MADPFFSTGQNINQDNKKPITSSNDENKDKIDDILAKQKHLEEEFLKLNSYLKTNKLNPEQIANVQKQMQELDFRYKQNVNLLKSLGVGQSSVKVTSNQTKSGSKISMKQFLVGCAIVLFLLVGGLAGIFYYLVTNPSQMTSVGVTPQTAKTLVQTFVVVFFGFLFLLGFALVIVNAYRLMTVKNKSKLGYFMGLFLGLIIFVLAIALGSTLLNRISNISVGDLSDPDKLLRPYIFLKDGDMSISEPELSLIAPGIIRFEMNTKVFDSQILPKLGQVQIQGVDLDCGNGQKLSIDMETAEFKDSCIYYAKGNYSLSIVVYYINSQTSEKLQQVFEAGSLEFKSEIRVSNKDNSVKNIPLDVIVGKVPSKVTFDASEVFKDFSLNDYEVIWDVNGDGSPDKTNDASFTYVYKEAKVYHIGVRFPKLNNFLYTFPVRVEQSDVPICEVIVDRIKGTDYSIKTNFLSSGVNITDYQFDIFDSEKGKVLDSIKNKKGFIDYTLASNGVYSIIVNFVTDEGKQGECESDDIEVGKTDFDIFYDIYYKSPQSPNFVKVDLQKSDMFVDGNLIIKEIPTVLKIDITKINPDSPNASKKVLLDSKPVFSSDNKNFQITIDENKDYQIDILVEDPNRDTKGQKTINVKINRDDIIGKLLISPDTVGMDPFTVQFDASTTKINDPLDEIVYFTWNFGDGEVKKNFSQSIISHTYRYDSKKEIGEYFPFVTLKTKKGREIVVGSGTRIIVKKSLVNLKINIDSHPAQLASVGDKVDFSVELNGLPKTMRWDFSDGNDLECRARECISASKVYSKPGTYNVKVFVTFEDKPDLDGNITLKIN